MEVSARQSGERFSDSIKDTHTHTAMIDLTIVLNAHQPPCMVNNGPLKSLLSFRQNDKT